MLLNQALGDDEELEELMIVETAVIAAPSSPTPSFSSPTRIHELSSALLDEQYGVLPALAGNHEARSARPKALLEGVTLRVQQLLTELSVIKIQTQYRRHRASIRVGAMLYRRRFVMSLLPALHAEFLEKACVGECVRVANAVYDEHHKRDRSKEMFNDETKAVCDAIVLDVSEGMLAALVSETIKECVEAYIKAKPQPTHNPLVVLITSLLDEVVSEMARQVAKEHVRQSVIDYLDMVHALIGFNFVCDDLLEADKAWAVALAEETVVEELENDAVRQLVGDVLDEQVAHTVAEVLNGMRSEFEKLQEARDRKAIEQVAAGRIGTEMLISHVLIHIADGLEKLYMEHYLRSLTKQMFMSRLIRLADAIEEPMALLHASPVQRHVFSRCVHPRLQSHLVRNVKQDEEAEIASIHNLETSLSSASASASLQPFVVPPGLAGLKYINSARADKALLLAAAEAADADQGQGQDQASASDATLAAEIRRQARRLEQEQKGLSFDEHEDENEHEHEDEHEDEHGDGVVTEEASAPAPAPANDPSDGDAESGPEAEAGPAQDAEAETNPIVTEPPDGEGEAAVEAASEAKDDDPEASSAREAASLARYGSKKAPSPLEKDVELARQDAVSHLSTATDSIKV